MKQFDEVQAIFNPKRTDDLVAGALDVIGRPDTWEAMWVIDKGPYEGEWAMSPTVNDWPFAWAPLCDLEVTCHAD